MQAQPTPNIALTVFQTMRPPFLFLSLSIVFMTTCVALFYGAQWSVFKFVLITLAAVLSHIAVNMLNEYYDFKSGLDLNTEKTPFSGGSGGLPSHPGAARTVLFVARLCVAVVGLIGLVLLMQMSSLIEMSVLLMLGLIGMVLMMFYTPKITESVFFSLISPGLAFGPVMVIGITLVWLESISSQVWLSLIVISLVPFLLVNNLLLLNQLPDRVPDERAGRKNVVIQYGSRIASRLFIFQLLLSMVLIEFSVLTGLWPDQLLLTMLCLVLVIPLVLLVWQHHDHLKRLMPALALNVVVNLLTPVLVGIGFLLAIP